MRFGQIKIHLPAKRTQNFDEERGGGHAVHVIIAKMTSDSFCSRRGANRLDSDGHVREQKRVGKVLEARREKIFNGGRFAETAIEQALREQGRDFEPRRQLTGKERLRCRERPAKFHYGLRF